MPTLDHNTTPTQDAVFETASTTLATNSVLRNTYFLLSLTLLFSSGIAWFATVTHPAPLGILWLLIGTYGLMFLTVYLRNSPWGLLSIFAFTGFMGYSIGPILNHYLTSFANGSELITLALGSTGLVFVSLSGYILVTRKNMSFLGGFLFAGMITALVLMVASIWIHTTGLQLAIAGLFSLLSCAMILYHTSNIVNGGETNYIMATMSLFVALFNLFLSLLQLFGAFSNRD